MTDPTYFDELHAARSDPWDLASSPYEQRKIQLLTGSLTRERYRRAFEPGCAIGVASLALAQRCDCLIAMDAADAAVRQARERTQGHENIVVKRGSIPADWPDDSFDLIVLSELLYYLDGEARRAVAARVVETLAPAGDLVAVHWRHPFAEAATTGDQVHTELAERLAASGVRVSSSHVEEDFRLDVFRRDPGSRLAPSEV